MEDHYPGPWTAEDGRNIRSARPPSYHIAEVTGGGGVEEYVYQHAKLIAMIPEMVEAIKFAYAALSKDALAVASGELEHILLRIAWEEKGVNNG